MPMLFHVSIASQPRENGKSRPDSACFKVTAGWEPKMIWQFSVVTQRASDTTRDGFQVAKLGHLPKVYLPHYQLGYLNFRH